MSEKMFVNAVGRIEKCDIIPFTYNMEPDRGPRIVGTCYLSEKPSFVTQVATAFVLNFDFSKFTVAQFSALS